MEELSDASFCEEREAWEEWDTQSSLSLQHEDVKEGRVAAEAGARRGAEPPRSTAYYYGDLERLKRRLSDTDLSDAKDEKPAAFRQRSFTEYARYQPPPSRPRDLALDDYGDRIYSKPDDGYAARAPLDYRVVGAGVEQRKAETYSTAGTFPMPQHKEKEPLLAELECVGRLPLVQLAGGGGGGGGGGGVRRSRSWYLCCPNTGQEEETSRESSWRYSSLRPVTAPPAPNHQHTFSFNMGEMSETAVCAVNGVGVAHEGREVARLRRALAAERARAAAEARAHDARLAELHGVIAELVRRRDTRDRARAIPEEESEHSASDACESTTQPAGELEQDGERSRTDLNDSSSLLSPAELPAPRAPPEEAGPGGARGDTDTSDYIGRSESLPTSVSLDNTDHIDALDSGQGVDMESRRAERRGRARRGAGGGEGDGCGHRCSHSTRRHSSEGDPSDKLPETCDCEADGRACGGGECCRSRALSCAEFVRQAECYLHAPAHGRCSEARVAARVRLRRMDEPQPEHGAECARSAHGDALTNSAEEDEASLPVSAARAKRLSADVRVLEGALADAKDTAERLWLTCALHESWSVCLCGALRAADRALETYDVLLALAESQHNRTERGAAELVARRLLGRLEAEAAGANTAVGDSLLSPGPWLHTAQWTESGGEWTAECEERLREHAARLKSETAAVRTERPPQPLHAHSLLTEEAGGAECGEGARRQDMECAVLAQEAAAAREERAAALAGLAVERARAAGLARALAALTAPSSPPHQPPVSGARHHVTQGACEPARVHSSGRGARRALAAETNL